MRRRSRSCAVRCEVWKGGCDIFLLFDALTAPSTTGAIPTRHCDGHLRLRLSPPRPIRFPPLPLDSTSLFCALSFPLSPADLCFSPFAPSFRFNLLRLRGDPSASFASPASSPLPLASLLPATILIRPHRKHLCPSLERGRASPWCGRIKRARRVELSREISLSL
ncbi:hypothetical protein AAT19DRAFT_14527 [Rhodotorula toruloides]|uniref:Uncharacterized protein n=1 Tax=Rhodotorula toruloides TaxID=5286 RepID=A0A2T0A840_RHOTO|nr:hypothetical protein AAT19DRAFT_14527 [Rhodotorula toruloides]